MEPVKPLLNSDKTIQTPAQSSSLQSLIEQAKECSIKGIQEFAANVAFTPTQDWIDAFEHVGLRFYPDYSVPHASFNLRHYSLEGAEPAPGKLWDGPVPPKPEPSWVPQNGEKIQYSNDDPRASVLTWSECWYIGKDRGDHVVRIREYSDYISTSMIRPYQKTQVTLDELLSVYASVKGLTQDSVELKPE